MIALRRATLVEQLSTILPGPANFVCEIGSGHGHFLTAYAQQHPDQVCVGLDIIGERVERATRKRNRARLDHLHFLHAEARLFLDALPTTAVISRVFILFPDPWPKTRHHKNRILQTDFLTLLRSKVGAAAEIFFRTDHKAYFEQASSVINLHPQWQITSVTWPFEFETVFQQRAETYFSFTAAAR
jgi:tRNA (guanine-N7-)-methyltransferase